MITITPQSAIYLLSCPLENDYQHQFLWSSKSAQESYFKGKVKVSFSNYTYVKKDNSVKVSANIDDIINCNYLFYTNVGFTTKTYYCFITKMEYVNENCTNIYFETDVYQTWQYDKDGNSLITYNKCFVEREHVADDTIGNNCVPEGLETGEYVIQAWDTFSMGSKLILVQASNRVTGLISQDKWYYSTNLGGIYYQGSVYVCHSQNELNTIISMYNTSGEIDSIYNVYVVPSVFIDSDAVYTVTWTEGTTTLGTGYIYGGNATPLDLTTTLSVPSKLDGYTPHNNKLFTYPYSYMLASNNEGSSNVYHYENFINPSSCTFRVQGVASVGASSIMRPLNYYQSDSSGNSEEAIMGAKYPTLNWNSDNFTNWLSQNAVNIAVGIGASGLQAVTGLASGNALELGGVFSEITNDMLSVYQHSFNPNSARGNTNGGDIGYCININPIKIYQYCPRQELSRTIDRYWCMYGYKVNMLKVPELNSRKLWNYVKTKGCNFDGYIPQEDLNRIRQMFDDGVTLWHTTDMYNYDLDNNTIVS